ncbi:MAG TPA: hypothetical protein VKA17_07570 [Gammaproteobacteria bacterium]|nr:hypothetical protein [Gammaproteobacteria bacterium]
MRKFLTNIFSVALLSLAFAAALPAATPETIDGVTRIHLEQHNGYFAARETLAGLEPGTYEFVVTNSAGKLVGFQLTDADGENLDMFPLEPGETRTSRVEITGEGFRYRCPINPTPWYEVSVSP